PTEPYFRTPTVRQEVPASRSSAPRPTYAARARDVWAAQRHPGREAGPQSQGSHRDGPATCHATARQCRTPQLSTGGRMKQVKLIAFGLAGSALLAACAEDPTQPQLTPDQAMFQTQAGRGDLDLDAFRDQVPSKHLVMFKGRAPGDF